MELRYALFGAAAGAIYGFTKLEPNNVAHDIGYMAGSMLGPALIGYAVGVFRKRKRRT